MCKIKVSGLTCEQHALRGGWGKESGVAWEAPPPAASRKQASGWWFGPSLGRALGDGEPRRWTHLLELSGQEVIHVHAGRPAGVLLALAEDVVWPAAWLGEHSPTASARCRHDVSSFCWLHVIRLPTAHRQTYQTCRTHTCQPYLLLI